MPLLEWDKAAYDLAYDYSGEPDGHPPDRPEVRLHYCRFTRYRHHRALATALVEKLGWSPSTRAVVVGCGFGWTMEALRDLGIAGIVGTDTSPYIQANKALSDENEIREAIAKASLTPDTARGAQILARSRSGVHSKFSDVILNENIWQSASRNRIRQAVGSNNFEILTESVLESLTDAECQQMSAVAHAMTAQRVAHYVYTGPAVSVLPLNWKTLSEWKTLLPADIFIEAETHRVA